MALLINQIRTASPASAFHVVKASDWGILPPGATGTAFTAGGNLVASTTSGSLATTTAAFKVTYVTALGETLPSAEATVAVTGPTGSVTVTVPANPQGTASNPEFIAQPILGWNVYSGSGAGNELKNTGASSDLSVTLSTAGAPVSYIPIATTSVVVKIYGAGAGVPVINTSGIQQALPSIAANNSADINIIVNRSFTPVKEVNYIRPASSADAGGLAPMLMDCVAPLWPQSTAVTAGATPSVIVVNSVGFLCTTAGTTAAAIPAGLTTRPLKGVTVADNTATWTSMGEVRIVRARFNNSTGSAGQPISQEYDLFQA